MMHDVLTCPIHQINSHVSERLPPSKIESLELEHVRVPH